ncbi:hypothetical protein SARC_01869 [Sphaeroforma arctica JP610]|uniref:Uncharacterized protein n=1 Tax=Sphaeroforma arctica JP610 TaxID=667725 RepID=A0A0L0GAM8_9EUKA|nr:hypothetical protein SARC_01869 [Sphaeroforma arctica JP610]KNC85964.1 hypothetical protein SARC_01869 [Sphaeroforma arctica JP610]|eukprot:XP_014159866.1 hypothetical protein SARC_01869 [Sphaeroforma arctica JP610]
MLIILSVWLRGPAWNGIDKQKTTAKGKDTTAAAKAKKTAAVLSATERSQLYASVVQLCTMEEEERAVTMLHPDYAFTRFGDELEISETHISYCSAPPI